MKALTGQPGSRLSWIVRQRRSAAAEPDEQKMPYFFQTCRRVAISVDGRVQGRSGVAVTARSNRGLDRSLGRGWSLEDVITK